MDDTEFHSCPWMPRLADLELTKQPFPVPAYAIKQAIREESLLRAAAAAITDHGADHPEAAQAYLQFRAESGKAVRAYAHDISAKLYARQRSLLSLPLTPLPTSPLQLLSMPTTASWPSGSQMVQSHPGNQLIALQIHALALLDNRERAALPEILSGAGVVSAIEKLLLDTRMYMGTGLYYKDYIALRLGGLQDNDGGLLAVEDPRWAIPISHAIAWASPSSPHPSVLIPWQRSLLSGLMSDHSQVKTRGVVHSSRQIKVVVDEGRPVILVRHTILDRLARSIGIRSYPAKMNPSLDKAVA